MTKEKILRGTLKRGKVYLDKEYATNLTSNGFGKVGRKYLVLDSLEALYLVFTQKLAVTDGKKDLDFEDLVKIFSKNEPCVLSQFLIYRDLRSRGYVVKRGYGEKIDFLVYGKGEYPRKPARFRVIGVDEGIPVKVGRLIDILGFSIMNKKELKLAVIERRGEVVYYTLTKFTKETLNEPA